MKYRLYYAGFDLPSPNAAMTIDTTPQISFLFDPANTDYQTFKTDIAAGVPLEDPEGNVMSQAEADAFLATLP
jgi:hypothetical protein